MLVVDRLDLTQLARDMRSPVVTPGRVADQVLYRADANAPELPMPGAIVALHRAADGKRAWVGASDAHGKYSADTLEAGVDYVPVALDPGGQYEAVAAGPVRAGALQIAPVTMIVGEPFAADLPLLGAQEPAAVTLAEGTLPSGAQLSGRFLSAAAPTGAPGRYAAAIDVSEAGKTTRVPLTIDLRLRPLEIAMRKQWPTGIVQTGVPIDPQAFTARGGEPPYAYAVSTGALPVGLSLDGVTGVLSGTPGVAGQKNFSVRVTDARGAQKTRNVAVRTSLDVYVDKVVNLIIVDAVATPPAATDYTGAVLTPIGGPVVHASGGPFGDGYVTFNGASQSLQAAYADGQRLVYDQDFTVELWLRIPNVTHANQVISRGNGNANALSWWINCNAGLLRSSFSSNGSGTPSTQLDSTILPTVGQWTHVALVNRNKALTVYVNGASGGAAPLAPFYASPSYGTRIGSFDYTLFPNWYEGDVASVRITNGVARYTGPFVPPTEPFAVT
ncbi:MAG: hypothetical protein EPN34_03020 [Burkholderiaceae bacterium]|nr:MAG: hypothetical protein EPN34_03020 [Burkholderiaceae bacterium]